MRNILPFQATALSVLLAATVNHATIATPAVFGSHMVLQRGQPIPVFGTGTSGESVTVTLGTQTKNTNTTNGAWKVELDAMSAGGPYTMTIKGTNTVTYTDVMVGEVWHCAGQSNMDTRMNYSEYSFDDSIKTANFPGLRYITMRQPGQTIKWQNVSPTTVGSMTATGYFFGRNLLDNLGGVAVGIVNTSVGGTVIKEWTDPVTVAATADLKDDSLAGGMYESWVKPVEGFAVKGTVWLQGENDASSSALTPAYDKRLEALIKGWRKAWAAPRMPFLVVGLCHKGALQTAVGESSNQGSIREAQRRVTDTMPNSLLAVAVDLGSATTWHYPQKPELGERLGAAARGWLYGQTGFVYSSPRPSGCFFRGSTIVIPWDANGGKLALSGGNTPTGFAVAGADGKWSWATASLNGDTVLLTTSLSKPTQVRFAWANQPTMNLVNEQGLPATPFQSNIAATAASTAAPVHTDKFRQLVASGRHLAFPSMNCPGQVVVLDASGRVVQRSLSSDLSAGVVIDPPAARGAFTVVAKSSRGQSLAGRVVFP